MKTHYKGLLNYGMLIYTLCRPIPPDDRRTPHGGFAGKHLFASPHDERPLLSNKDSHPEILFLYILC